MVITALESDKFAKHAIDLVVKLEDLMGATAELCKTFTVIVKVELTNGECVETHRPINITRTK